MFQLLMMCCALLGSYQLCGMEERIFMEDTDTASIDRSTVKEENIIAAIKEIPNVSLTVKFSTDNFSKIELYTMCANVTGKEFKQHVENQYKIPVESQIICDAHYREIPDEAEIGELGKIIVFKCPSFVNQNKRQNLYTNQAKDDENTECLCM